MAKDLLSEKTERLRLPNRAEYGLFPKLTYQTFIIYNLLQFPDQK